VTGKMPGSSPTNATLEEITVYNNQLINQLHKFTNSTQCTRPCKRSPLVLPA